MLGKLSGVLDMLLSWGLCAAWGEPPAEMGRLGGRAPLLPFPGAGSSRGCSATSPLPSHLQPSHLPHKLFGVHHVGLFVESPAMRLISRYERVGGCVYVCVWGGGI